MRVRCDRPWMMVEWGGRIETWREKVAVGAGASRHVLSKDGLGRF
jgi:hypothetical protein